MVPHKIRTKVWAAWKKLKEAGRFLKWNPEDEDYQGMFASRMRLYARAKHEAKKAVEAKLVKRGELDDGHPPVPGDEVPQGSERP